MTELDNDTIRRISPAGVVTTLAGSAGLFGGGDGTGVAARFNRPEGVATDDAGNVYVADGFNSTIRKITPAGVVTTFAGMAGVKGSADGTSSAARFYYPSGVAVDGSGNVYVADPFNGKIRRISPQGVVTSLPGAFYANGVAIDNAGNVYAAGDGTIRKITPSGVVTTLAGLAGTEADADGNGSEARFVGPHGVAVDSAGNIYATDGYHTIRKITAAGVVTTLAGKALFVGSADGTGNAARFNDPHGITAGADGNLYVAEIGNHLIRKITPAGVVTTVAGSAGNPGEDDGSGSAARFFDPVGVALDGAGNIYVADNRTNGIRKITPAAVVTTLAGCTTCTLGGSTDGTGSNARFKNPGGVATDSGGNVYVADAGNNTIRKITPSGVVSTLAGSAALPFGSADGTGSAASFHLPFGVATDNGGNVYVADRENQTIRKITPAGVVTTFAGSAGISGSADGTGSSARFRTPYGVATDSSGNVYVADYGNSAVRKITPAGVVTTLARELSSAAVTIDSAGNIYVAGGPSGHAIRRISPTGEVTIVGGSDSEGCEEGTGSAARFTSVYGIATDRSGNVYLADTFNYKIRVGKPALTDVATIDFPTAVIGTTRQLSTFPLTATSWQWSFIRQPSGSGATLSSTSIRNPIFLPDVADLYVFQLTASDGAKTSVTTVSLTATAPPPLDPGPRRRAVGH